MFVFRLAIFVGAFLLFAVQPLLARYILPWFGGQPGVWATSLVFFQTALVAGYGYAYFLDRRFAPRTQVLIHGALLVGALVLLPITPPETWKPTGPGDPTGRILLLLLFTVGMQYFLLSATAPLLQAWFRRVHPAHSPYRLYAWSNAASLLALLSYPLLIERFLGRTQQAVDWSLAFVGFAGLTIWGAIPMWRSRGTAASPGTEAAGEEGPAPPLAVRALWVGLPMSASMLLVAFTNQLSTDVAAMPLFWILPLTVYLLSFIVAFGSERWYRRPWALVLVVPALGALLWALARGPYLGLAAQIGIYVGALFVLCMALHGELARHKPNPRRLTGYYMAIAAGGALGGALVALAAPRIFQITLEFHLGILLAVGALLLARLTGAGAAPTFRTAWRRWVPALAGYVLLALALGHNVIGAFDDMVDKRRNFYGVLSTLWEDRGTAAASLVLFNGQISHGLQFLSPILSRRPTGYYGRNSGVGIAMRHFPKNHARRIGMVGLGIGTVTAYGNQGDSFRIYEINPEVERVARRYFRYLRDARARVEVVLGDARLMLEREPPQRFDVLVLDAFSSDAIPVHLLTREAFDLYRRHLAPDGLLAVHLTNRHFALEPIVRAATLSWGWTPLLIVTPDGPFETWTSDWLLLTANAGFLNDRDVLAAARESERQLTPHPARQAWTDDSIDLIQAVIW